MNCLFTFSIEEKLPINIMYMNDKGEITFRTVVVRKINPDSIFVFDFVKQQVRTFKRANILSAAKQQRRKEVGYA